MVANGFNEINEKMDKKFQVVDKRFEAVNERFDAVDRRFDIIEDKLEDLKAEVEHRRVHVFDHKDLEHRVERLEEKVFPRTLAKRNA